MATPVPVPTRPACVSRLCIAGFKTFADPVGLDILPGLTGLVGPNGCGKSNIVDALRWAMGEGNEAIEARALERAWAIMRHAGRGTLPDGGCAYHVVRIVQMDRYRLHYFPESGNSYKLALMLTLCGQTFEPVWTDFAARVTWTPEWRRTVNAMGEIPVLEASGVSLTQTGPILLHLAEKYDRLGGIDEGERFEVLRWLFWDNQKLSGFMAAYRFRRTFARNADPAVLAFLRGRVDDFLGIVEERVTSRPFVVGDRATIVDLSMCAYLSFPADETGYELSVSHPHVHAWLRRIAALPGWQAPYDLLPGQHLPRYA